MRKKLRVSFFLENKAGLGSKWWKVKVVVDWQFMENVLYLWMAYYIKSDLNKSNLMAKIGDGGGGHHVWAMLSQDLSFLKSIKLNINNKLKSLFKKKKSFFCWVYYIYKALPQCWSSFSCSQPFHKSVRFSCEKYGHCEHLLVVCCPRKTKLHYKHKRFIGWSGEGIARSHG